MEKKITVIPANQIRGKSKTQQKKKLRVAAYCRVSTEQEEQLGSFANQVEYYTKYINNNPDYELVDIFADEGITGTNTKKREGFQQLIQACDDGKVDLVITKSISRFARNTADCLHYSRHLKSLGIPIKFEKEGINTMDASGELLFTILSSLAQEESRNISENTQWGIRSKFQKGIPHLNTDCFLGYDKDENGHLIVNEEQAAIVKRIFRDFVEGWQVSEISKQLNDENIPGVHGEAKWYPITIVRILQNEKYKGDLLMQKFYTVDYLTKEQTENDGKLNQYYVENDHEAIIEKDVWDAVQIEIERRAEFRKEHSIREMGSCTLDPFAGRVFCGHCGDKYVRKYWKGIRSVFWKCASAEKKKGKTCCSENVREETMKKAVVVAWNSIIEHRDEYLSEWEAKIQNGNALERLRAIQMIELTAEGRIENEIPELTRMVLQEMIIIDKETFRITFLDGTVKNVRI